MNRILILQLKKKTRHFLKLPYKATNSSKSGVLNWTACGPYMAQEIRARKKMDPQWCIIEQAGP